MCSQALKSFVFDFASSASRVFHVAGSGVLNLAYFWAPLGGGKKVDFLGLAGGGRGGGGKFEPVGDLEGPFLEGGGGASV